MSYSVSLRNKARPSNTYQFFVDNLGELYNKLSTASGLPNSSLFITPNPQTGLNGNVDFRTMQDDFKTFWEKVKRSGVIDPPKGLSSFFSRVEDVPPRKQDNVADQTGRWLMYYLLEGMSNAEVSTNDVFLVDGLDDNIRQMIDKLRFKSENKSKNIIVEWPFTMDTESWKQIWMSALQKKVDSFLEEMRRELPVQIIPSQVAAPAPSLIPIASSDNIDKTIHTSLLQFTLPFKRKDSSLDYIFASLKSSVDVPLLTLYGIYKLNVNDLSEIDYNFEISEYKRFIKQVMALNLVPEENLSKYDDFAKNNMIILQFADNNKIAIVMFRHHDGQLNVVVPQTNLNKLDTVFENLMPNRSEFDNALTNSHKMYVEGTIYVPDLVVDPFVMSTFLLLHPSFESRHLRDFIAIDESKYPREQPQTTYFWLEGAVSGVSSMDKKNGEVSIEVVPFQGKLSTKLQFSDIKTVEVYHRAVQLYRQMLYTYREQEPTILKTLEQCGYRRFQFDISSWTVKDLIGLLTKINYDRGCSHQPVPITREMASTINEQHWGRFTYQGNDMYLSCHADKDGFRTFGLKPNNQGMRNELPELPCCYKNPREVKAVRTTQQHLKTTQSQAMDPGHRGSLPRNLEHFLYSLSHQRNFVRVGMDDTYWSFLDCILHVLNEEYAKEDDTDARMKIMQKVLFEVSTSETHLAAGAQSWSIGNSLENIREELANFPQKSYLSPKKWLRIFESFFDCSIFVFSHIPDDNYNAKPVFPQFEMFDASLYIPRPNAIFIYEHPNIDDLVKCELIGLTGPDKVRSIGIQYEFAQMGEAYLPIYLNFISNYKLAIQPRANITTRSCQWSAIHFDALNPYDTFTHQIIDQYGKCRGFVDKEDIVYWVDPCPPFQLPIRVFSNELFRPRNIIRNKFVTFVTSISTIGNSVKEVHLEMPEKLPSIQLTVKVNDVVENWQSFDRIDMKYPNFDEESTNFEYYQKLAMVTEQYFLYYFANHFDSELKWNDYARFDDKKKYEKEQFLLKWVHENIRLKDSVGHKEQFIFPVNNIFVDKETQRFLIPKLEDRSMKWGRTRKEKKKDAPDLPIDENVFAEPLTKLIRTFLQSLNVSRDFDIQKWIESSFQVSSHSRIFPNNFSLSTEDELETDVLKANFFVLFVLEKLVNDLVEQGFNPRIPSISKSDIDHHTKTLEAIYSFVVERVDVDQQVQYEMPKDPRLSNDVLKSNRFVNGGGFFVCDSVETMKKLVYSLLYRLSIGENIAVYKNLGEIPNFYKYLQDWSSDDATLVVDNLKPFALSHEMAHTVGDDTLMRFLRHPDVNGNKVVVAKLSEDQDESIKYSNLWNQHEVSDIIIPAQENLPIVNRLVQSQIVLQKGDIEFSSSEKTTGAGQTVAHTLSIVLPDQSTKSFAVLPIEK